MHLAYKRTVTMRMIPLQMMALSVLVLGIGSGEAQAGCAKPEGNFLNSCRDVVYGSIGDLKCYVTAKCTKEDGSEISAASYYLSIYPNPKFNNYNGELVYKWF